MSLTRKLALAAIAAIAALALTAPVASAGWQIRNATTNALYNGPVTMSLSPGTVAAWSWLTAGNQADVCGTSTLSGSVSNPGLPPAATGSLSSAGWSGCMGNYWPFSPYNGSWTGVSTPWTLAVGTFGGNQAKLTIQNPRARRHYSGTYLEYAGATLEGKMVNVPGGTVEVQFSDTNDAQGLNNTLPLVSGSTPVTTVDLQATYRLTGGGANLKVVLVP